MGGTCITHRQMGMYTEFLLEDVTGRDHMEDLGVYGEDNW